MARPIRHLEPGRLWFVTNRCLQAQYLLRPDRECVNVLGYWLAMAMARFPDVKVLAFLAMSNHLHMTLRDGRGQLSAFLEYFHGNVARDINGLRGREGPLFHGRSHAVPIVEDGATLMRIVYTLANPAKAGLVRSYSEWPGLVAFAGDGRKQVFTRPPRLADDPDTPRPTVVLELPPVEGAPAPQEILAAVTESEAALAEARGAKPVLGSSKVLAQSPFAAPARPKRTPQPLCHPVTRAAFDAFRTAWRALVAAYHGASAAWRAGDRTVEFPAFTFAPRVFQPG